MSKPNCGAVSSVGRSFVNLRRNPEIFAGRDLGYDMDATTVLAIEDALTLNGQAEKGRHRESLRAPGKKRRGTLSYSKSTDRDEIGIVR